ncbi:MAG: phycobiliprotein lyase [Prochlorococcus sp.]
MKEAQSPAFPPADLAEFLSLCVGEWMTLRSQFAVSDGDDEWHSSERSDLNVNLLPAEQGEIGGLAVRPQSGDLSSLLFVEDGALQISSAAGEQRQGRWQFWPDGSVELSFLRADGVQLQERIWFTKANLRLRSTTAIDKAGLPHQASFCSEIRRVSRPTS